MPQFVWWITNHSDIQGGDGAVSFAHHENLVRAMITGYKRSMGDDT
jgi:hypothetical protein